MPGAGTEAPGQPALARMVLKDRFTLSLLVIVAFVGGLLAMVVIARWQTDKTESPTAQSSTVAQAVPEVEPEIAPPAPVAPPAEETARDAETEPEPREVEGVAATGDVHAPSRPDRTGGTAESAGAEARNANRLEENRRASVPDPRSPQRDPSTAPSGAGNTASADYGRGSGTKSSSGALYSDRGSSVNTSGAAVGRSSGRQPAAGSETASPPDTGGAVEEDSIIPDDTQQQDPNDPRFVPPRKDDPPEEPEVEPEVEPEPEPPPSALVRAYPAAHRVQY